LNHITELTAELVFTFMETNVSKLFISQLFVVRFVVTTSSVQILGKILHIAQYIFVGYTQSHMFLMTDSQVADENFLALVDDKFNRYYVRETQNLK